MISNEHIRIGNNYYKKVKTFKYLDYLAINQNSIEIKYRLKIHVNILFKHFCLLNFTIKIWKLKYIEQ